MKADKKHEIPAFLEEIESTKDVVTISRKAKWMRLARKVIDYRPTLLNKIQSEKQFPQTGQWTDTYDPLKIKSRLILAEIPIVQNQ